jgi:hypothetical protein
VRARGSRPLPGADVHAGAGAGASSSVTGGLGASYLALSRYLGLHDICAPGWSQDGNRLAPRPVCHSSRRSGSPDHLVITWDRERMQQGGTRMLCKGIIDQQPACQLLQLGRGPRRILLNRRKMSRPKLASRQRLLLTSLPCLSGSSPQVPQARS